MATKALLEGASKKRGTMQPDLSIFAKMLGGVAHSRSEALVFCPAHDNRKTPALSLSLRSGSVFWHCHAGCRQEDVTSALVKLGILPKTKRRRHGRAKPFNTPRPPLPDLYRRPHASLRVKEQDAKKEETLRRIASACTDSALPLLKNYLEHRGLPRCFPSLDLRVAPRFPFKQEGRFVPAMVAVIRAHDSSRIGLEAHFLQSDGRGKACLEVSKKVYGNRTGGGVWLREEEDLDLENGELWLCEGVLTGLALQIWLDHFKPGSVVLCALSAHNMHKLELPRQAKRLILALDHDKAGIEAGRKALELYKRQRRNVEFRLPPKEGDDWLDTLKGQLE